MQIKHLIRYITVIFVLCMSFTVCFADVPDPSDYFYVADYADVLSESTENSILAGSEYLEEQCGAQIVVATVDFTDGMEMEDYAYKMFNSWQIGGSSNNGVLILLSIGDDNYWVMQGKGLESTLSSSVLQNVLDTYMEPDFAVQNYDSAVIATYDQLYDKVADIYNVSFDYDGYQSDTGQNKGGSVLLGFVIILILLIIMMLILVSVSGRNRGRRNNPPPNQNRSSVDPSMLGLIGLMSMRSRHRHRSAPPPPPPHHHGGMGGMPPSRPQSPSAGRPTHSSGSMRPSTGSSASRPSGGSRPTTGFSGSRHTGGGGSSRGGGAGRR